MHERWRAETGAVWAVARAAEGRALGLAGWNDVDLADGSAEIVYWVLPGARGGGVVAEAVRRLSRWALEDLGLYRLRLCHSVANPASCRVADRTGFVLEGTMRGALLHEDGRHDQHLHALVRGGPAGHPVNAPPGSGRSPTAPPQPAGAGRRTSATGASRPGCPLRVVPRPGRRGRGC